MTQLRQMLRLAGSGTNSREICGRIGIARSTAQDNMQRAAAVGLSWPLPEPIDDALEHKLFSRKGAREGTVDKVFVDYPGKRIPIVDRKTGEIREAEIFVRAGVRPDWIGSHVRMFRCLGGVPRLIVPTIRSRRQPRQLPRSPRSIAATA